jgi:hypothetical protein
MGRCRSVLRKPGRSLSRIRTRSIQTDVDNRPFLLCQAVSAKTQSRGTHVSLKQIELRLTEWTSLFSAASQTCEINDTLRLEQVSTVLIQM